jgi:hypothetical protein
LADAFAMRCRASFLRHRDSGPICTPAGR